ncbi:MAG: hypothetical protein ABI415_01805 [Flavitalea sp.]
MRFLLISALILVVFSCKKKSEAVDPIKPEDRAKAIAFMEYLQNKKLSLEKYYSEVPIDYIDTDQVVKSETQLWPYVSAWIPDDTYTFLANNEVDIAQDSIRIEGNTNAILKLRYTVTPDIDGVAFNFVGHDYLYLKYRLKSFSPDSIVVNAKWNGSKVYSVFKVLH